MANISTVRITSNVDEVKNALPEVLEKALMEIGIEAEAHAKEIMTNMSPKPPIDTGLLRNSITWAIGGEKANISNYAGEKPSKYNPNAPIPVGDPYTGTAPKRAEPCVYIGSNVEYAEVIETGARGMAPRPFLRPAIEDFRQEYKEILENNLKNG